MSASGPGGRADPRPRPRGGRAGRRGSRRPRVVPHLPEAAGVARPTDRGAAPTIPRHDERPQDPNRRPARARAGSHAGAPPARGCPRPCLTRVLTPTSGRRAHDGEPGAGEILVSSQLFQLRSSRRGRRGAPAQRDRCDRDDHLVQQADVGELTGQVSSADDPDVPITCRGDHLRVHRGDVRAGELDACVEDDLQLSMREHPAGEVVRPLPLRRVLTGELVVEDPPYVVEPIASAPTRAMNSR